MIAFLTRIGNVLGMIVETLCRWALNAILLFIGATCLFAGLFAELINTSIPMAIVFRLCFIAFGALFLWIGWPTKFQTK